MTAIEKLVHEIPKAELHLHIEGTLEPEMLFTLAKRNGIKLRFGSPQEIRRAYQFSNLQSFLDIYYEGVCVLQKEQDFFDLTWAYLEKIASENVRHTEIFFDPQSHTDRGIEMSTVVTGITNALEEARKRWNLTSHLILCFLRHLDEESALKTLEQAIPFKKKIVAVGLDSSEKGHPPSKFERVFERARREGFLTVAHAGEEGPPSYIWEALDLLKIQRIDHGVRCLEDPKLVERLAKDRTPLTVCPLSNIKLCVFSTMEKHNLKQLLSKNLCATINSDDPAYFGGYLEQNYLEAQRALSLSPLEIVTLAKNSFEAAFLPQTEKAKHISEIDSIAGRNGV